MNRTCTECGRALNHAYCSKCAVPTHPKGPGKVTMFDIRRYTNYYLAGPGRDSADESFCEHEYRLTDSCPNCDFTVL